MSSIVPQVVLLHTPALTQSPVAVLEDSARIYGWTSLFLKRVLPSIFQRKNFHVKRKADRTLKEGTVFLNKIARQIKVAMAEKRKEDLVQTLIERLSAIPVSDIPQEIVDHLPKEPWEGIKAKDARVEAEMAQVTADKSKDELMTTFQSFPHCFLELVYKLREHKMFPDEDKNIVWMGRDWNSMMLLNRANIMRVLGQRDTSGWVLPQEFFDVDLPEYDPESTGAAVVAQQIPGKHKAPPEARIGGVGGTISGELEGGRGGRGGGAARNLDTCLATAALNVVGKQDRGDKASDETAGYWKQKEEIERENAKRAKIDSEVHRFKVLDQILPTLDATTREEMNRHLQKQKADFCRRLLQVGNQNDGVVDHASPAGVERGNTHPKLDIA